MRELPLPFSDPMVLATMRVRDPKTQTRRVVTWPAGVEVDECELARLAAANDPALLARCPYGRPGDRLYVREAFRFPDYFDDKSPQLVMLWAAAHGVAPLDVPVRFEADGAGRAWRDTRTPTTPARDFKPGKCRPPMFMPKLLARIWLEVVCVRVERVQRITEADALAEGIYLFPGEGGGYKAARGEQEYDTAVEAYQHLWGRLNASRGHGWSTNPWVWVIEFRRIKL